MPHDDVIAGFRRRETAALARAISLVENQRDGFEALLSGLHAELGRAHRIGITGPPGAGKSTLVEQLVRHYRGRRLTVGVVAVDPTSPFTGGALLGDRIRMEGVSLDPGVYIRSMATRGSLGGLATTTREVADLLDAFGFERVLIETVGVGQSELDVARAADTTVVVLVPESGDGIQTLKAGLFEVADVYVVNKSDRPGADRLRQEMQVMLGIRKGQAFRNVPAHHGRDLKGGGRLDSRTVGPQHGAGGNRPTVRPSDRPTGWEPPVLATAAPQGEGVAELADAVERHREWLAASGELGERRRRRFAERTREVVNRALRQWVWDESRAEDTLGRRLAEVERGAVSPYELANAIVEQLKAGAAQ